MKQENLSVTVLWRPLPTRRPALKSRKCILSVLNKLTLALKGLARPFSAFPGGHSLYPLLGSNVSQLSFHSSLPISHSPPLGLVKYLVFSTAFLLCHPSAAQSLLHPHISLNVGRKSQEPTSHTGSPNKLPFSAVDGQTLPPCLTREQPEL